MSRAFDRHKDGVDVTDSMVDSQLAVGPRRASGLEELYLYATKSKSPYGLIASWFDTSTQYASMHNASATNARRF